MSENLSKLYPVLIFVLYLAAVLKKIVYFHFFDIDITEYLKTSETLIIFTRDIVLMAVGFISAFFITVLQTIK